MAISTPIQKLLFLEILHKQLPNPYTSDYNETYRLLSENEKIEHAKLHREIHQIWSFINSPIVKGAKERSVSNAMEYHEQVHPISHEILSLIEDFDFTLKRESQFTEEQKRLFKKIFGINLPD